jgi:hypothetical protein
MVSKSLLLDGLGSLDDHSYDGGKYRRPSGELSFWVQTELRRYSYISATIRN